MKTLNNYITEELPELRLRKDYLFTTNINLWEVYLNSFKNEKERQHHNCSACRRFIEKYGGLVYIDKNSGKLESALWSDSLNTYKEVGELLKNAVENSTVNGIFLSTKDILGTPETDGWGHFTVKNPNYFRYKNHLSVNQQRAEKKEDFRNISRVIHMYNEDLLEKVVEITKQELLYGSNKITDQAQWLFDLKKKIRTGIDKKNIIWRSVAEAPSGFCHPRSSMIGTLLDDLSEGVDLDSAAKRFKAKMHPLQYRRPSSAPSESLINNAERLVEKLGVTTALRRRYATYEDIEFIWKPSKEEITDATEGVFGKLRENKEVNVESTKVTKISWKKFNEEILPKVKKIEVLTESWNLPFITLVTAVDEEAKNIFQWDSNVSWYTWHGGSPPQNYNLSGRWQEVTGITQLPFMWGECSLSNFNENILFILKNARESVNKGNAIFPETLRSEFHSIRKVIERYSKETDIEDIEQPHIVGLGLGSTIKVTTSIVSQYEIDRME